MKRWLFALTALLLLLAPLKFSAPVNLQTLTVPPATLVEWLYWAWPNQLGIIAAAILVLLLALECGPAMRPGLLGVLPLVWLVTQVVAVPSAICWQTAVDTLLHFGACAAVFYAAARCVREPRWENWLLGALTLATLLVCVMALEQQFGGLEATRRFASEQEGLSDAIRAKLTSRRVFGPFTSPNSLAGFLAVAFAPVLVWLASKAEGKATKALVVAFGGGLIVACLALSGSRGGLVAFGAGVAAVVLFRKCSGRQRLLAVLAVAAVLGASWMGGLIHLGRSSLEARMDYWGGAARIIRDHPWLGTGPGTFGSIYPKYKTALTEEAQLVHNDFLQMWSDSGVAAFVVFAALWAVGLWEAARLARRRGDALGAALVAALVAWTVHGLVDFDLYVPGMALPAFGLLGMVCGLSRECNPQPVKRRWTWVALAALVAGAVLWFEGRMLAASAAYGEAQVAVGEDRLRAAVSATRFAPRNPQYWVTAGDAAMQLRDAELAVECYKKAVDLDPRRAARYVRLARAYWAAGKPVSAVMALRWAVALNPTEQGYRQELKGAEESVRQGRGSLLQSRPS